jgi:hypothetical protein
MWSPIFYAAQTKFKFIFGHSGHSNKPAIKKILMEQIILIFSMAPLLVQPSGDMSVKIYKELCEDASAVPDKMKHIMEWLAMQPHLPPFEGKKFQNM